MKKYVKQGQMHFPNQEFTAPQPLQSPLPDSIQAPDLSKSFGSGDQFSSPFNPFIPILESLPTTTSLKREFSVNSDCSVKVETPNLLSSKGPSLFSGEAAAALAAKQQLQQNSTSSPQVMMSKEELEEAYQRFLFMQSSQMLFHSFQQQQQQMPANLFFNMMQQSMPSFSNKQQQDQTSSLFDDQQASQQAQMFQAMSLMNSQKMKKNLQNPFGNFLNMQQQFDFFNANHNNLFGESNSNNQDKNQNGNNMNQSQNSQELPKKKRRGSFQNNNREETKNLLKIYSLGFHKYIEHTYQEIYGVSKEQIMGYLQNNRLESYTLKGLRQMWERSTHAPKTPKEEDVQKFNKIIRIYCKRFLQTEALSYFLTHSRTKNPYIILKYRSVLLQFLYEPENLRYLKLRDKNNDLCDNEDEVASQTNNNNISQNYDISTEGSPKNFNNSLKRKGSLCLGNLVTQKKVKLQKSYSEQQSPAPSPKMMNFNLKMNDEINISSNTSNHMDNILMTSPRHRNNNSNNSNNSSNSSNNNGNVQTPTKTLFKEEEENQQQLSNTSQQEQVAPKIPTIVENSSEMETEKL